jgi:hypothetical protein
VQESAWTSAGQWFVRTAIGTGLAVAVTLVPGAAADGLPIAVPSPDAIESGHD